MCTDTPLGIGQMSWTVFPLGKCTPFLSVQVLSITNSNALVKPFSIQSCQGYHWDFGQSKDFRADVFMNLFLISLLFAIYLSVCPNLKFEKFCKVERKLRQLPDSISGLKVPVMFCIFMVYFHSASKKNVLWVRFKSLTPALVPSPACWLTISLAHSHGAVVECVYQVLESQMESCWIFSYLKWLGKLLAFQISHNADCSFKAQF